jgi:hypothetical protein
VREEFPTAQAHAMSWDASIKLDTQKEKVKIFEKRRCLERRQKIGIKRSIEVPVSAIDRTRFAIERTCDRVHGASDRALLRLSPRAMIERTPCTPELPL